MPPLPPLPVAARIERGRAASRIVLTIGGAEAWLVRGARGAHLSPRDSADAVPIADAMLAWLGAAPTANRAGSLHAIPFDLDDRVDRDDPVSLESMRMDIRLVDGVIPLELDLDEAAGTGALALLDPGSRDRLTELVTRTLTSPDAARLDRLEQLALPPYLTAPCAPTGNGVLAIATNHSSEAALWTWTPGAAPREVAGVAIPGTVFAVAPGPGADEVTVYTVHAETSGSWAPSDPCSIVIVDVAAGTVRPVVDRRPSIWYEPGLRWSPDGRLAVAVSYEVPSSPTRRLRSAIDILDAAGNVIASSPKYVQVRQPRWVDGRVMCAVSGAGAGELRPDFISWDPMTNAVDAVDTFTETSYAGHAVTADDAGVRVGGKPDPLAGVLQRRDWTTPATWLDSTTCVVQAFLAADPNGPAKLIAIDAITGKWSRLVRHSWPCTAHVLAGAAVVVDHDYRLWWTKI